MEAICDDLAAEQAALDQVVADLSDEQWLLQTPADGWAVRDQISHLAYFDEAGTLAVVDAAGFRSAAEELQNSAGGDPVLISLEKGRSVSPRELLAWWRQARNEVTSVFRTVGPKERLPWYGPDMGARSFATARLMETWAHGQDIVDALGVEREATDRLRHVAHIANGARPYAYFVNAMDVPEAGVRVELTAPSGETWTWGDEAATDSITGAALDFCLVAIQRRHLDDVDLTIAGDAAHEWSKIIQTFAGGAGTGRAPLS